MVRRSTSPFFRSVIGTCALYEWRVGTTVLRLRTGNALREKDGALITGWATDAGAAAGEGLGAAGAADFAAELIHRVIGNDPGYEERVREEVEGKNENWCNFAVFN